MNTAERNYTAVVMLTNKLPSDIIRYIITNYASSTYKERTPNRLRSYKLKGNKAKFLALIRREWATKVCRTIHYANGKWKHTGANPSKFGMKDMVYVAKSGYWSWNDDASVSIIQIINRLLKANTSRLLDMLELIEKFLIENKYIKN